MVIIPKISGLMSILGSIALIRDLLKGPRAERKQITSKVLIAMNISDLIGTSIMHVIGTWFVPKGTLFWSAGNEHTCDIQGWSQVLFYPYALLYNAVLSIIFLLLVRYSWSEEDFRKWSYVILCAPPVLVTLISIPRMRYYKYMNDEGGWFCSFTPSPPGCDRIPDMECNEDNLDIYTYYRLYGVCLLLLSTSIIIYACVRLFLVARRSDESVSAYRSSARSRAQGNYATSNRVAVSGLLYSGGNLLVVLPTIILFIGLIAKVNGASFFWTFFNLQLAIFLPLQGFLNALVYFRPKYLEYKKEKRKENLEYKKAYKEAKTKEIITNMLEIPGI